MVSEASDSADDNRQAVAPPPHTSIRRSTQRAGTPRATERLGIPSLMCWLASTAALAWSFGLTRMLNSNIGFHLAAGRAIAESGRIPRTDSWSFTAAGRPWHNHEWLSGLFFWEWSELFGVESLVVWQWLILAAASVLLFDVLRRWCGPLLAFLSLLVCLFVASPFFDIRPHLWSLLGFALLLRLTFVPSRAALGLPAVFALWANLHGGVVFGLMALGAIVVAWSLSPETGREVRRQGQVLFLACLMATLLNPFGWRVLTYPLGLAVAGSSPTRRFLVEWTSPLQPGGILSPAFLPVLAGTALLGLVLATSREKRRQPESIACFSSCSRHRWRSLAAGSFHSSASPPP